MPLTKIAQLYLNSEGYRDRCASNRANASMNVKLKTRHQRNPGNACPDQDALEAFLASRCADEEATRIERHIERCDRCRSWIDEAREDESILPIVRDLMTNGHAPASVIGTPPESIAGYRIITLIGEGGMGVVYEAEQQHPKRRVALKMLRTGMRSASALRRFEQEANLLGRLHHPAIAQIHEAGTIETESGAQPFLVMELIEGDSLTDYAMQHELSHDDRLALLADIADAVHHAHERGIVHRDLKPSNILVDRSGRPRILDFGVARLMDHDDRSATSRTQTGQLVGTIAYMSPEQMSRGGDQIDPRSDVYALGVLGYQLLSSRLPHDVAREPIPQAVRRIEEDDPTLLGSIDRALRGEIETIIARTLEKEPDRRYDSARAFADDIRRYLHHEPIAARPPSAIYQLRKFARRHRAMAAGIMIGCAGLLIGTAAATWWAISAAADAEAARIETQRSERTVEFLKSILASANPKSGRGDPTVREVLDAAAARLEIELADEPEVLASLHETLGDTYVTLSELDKAEHHLRAAWRTHQSLHGVHDHRADCSLRLLIDCLHYKGNSDEAIALLNGALEHVRSQELSNTFHNAWKVESLARINYDLGRYDEALPLAERALNQWSDVSGRSSADAARAMALLAQVQHCTAHDIEAAIALLRQSIDIQSARDEADVTQVTLALGALLQMHLQRGTADDLADAESIAYRNIALLEQAHGPNSMGVAASIAELAAVRLAQGQDDEAERLMRDALDRKIALLGDDHIEVAQTHRNLGMLLAHLGRSAEAAQSFDDAYRIYLETLGPKDARTMSALSRRNNAARGAQPPNATK